MAGVRFCVGGALDVDGDCDTMRKIVDEYDRL
jgi:hypothetical protein